MDFLATSVTDDIRPFADSDIVVRRRWYRVPEDTPLLGVSSAFLSVHNELDPWSREGAGSVWPPNPTYTRRGTPDGFDYAHVCGDADDFAGAALLDPDADVTYDDEWIPECCGRESVCTTQLCGQEPVYDRPAAQLWSYSIRHQDADEFTPVTLSQVAQNQGNTTPASPGSLWAWYSAGAVAAPTVSVERVADLAGVLLRDTTTRRFAADNAITEHLDAAEWRRTVQQGGVSGSLTAKIVAGKLELCGDNATICAELLPPGVALQTFDQPGPAGTDVLTATEIIATDNVVGAFAPGAGVRLPTADFGLWPTISINHNALQPAPLRVYAGLGGASFYLPGGGIVAFIDLPASSVAVFRNTNAGRWTIVEQYSYAAVSPPTPGTVTSVNLSTGSAGLVTAGGPVTSSGTLTVDLAPELDSLIPFESIDGILAGSLASGWQTAAMGNWLQYAAGTLSVLPPALTSGQFVATTFVITAGSATYQATGNTFTLPAAGTYLITGKIRGDIQPASAGGHYLSAKLRNVTLGADLANSETMVATSGTSGIYAGASGAFTAIVTVAGATTFELYAQRVGASFTLSQITSDTNGRTVFDYVRLY